MKKRILVISSANIDFVQNVTRMPHAGETVTEELSYEYVPGGKGANSALTFAKLGADTVFCTKLGKDDNGDRLINLYNDYGIDTSYIIRDKSAPTGLASVIVEKEGQNRIIVYPGANARLDEADVEESFNSLPDAVFVHLEIPNEAVYAASEFARERNIPFFVDAGPVKDDFNISRVARAEIFSPNETECMALTGINPDSLENCLRACIKLASMGEFKYIVLKLGSRGSFVYDGKYYNVFPVQKVQAVDTTAAGDIYTAAVCYAYMLKGDIKEAARFATLAAALSVTRKGASTSVPSLKEVKQFAKERKGTRQ